MTIGPRVRERRTASGLSQEQLARQAGVSLNALHKLEMGRITDPHYSTLSGIAHALGVSVDELVGEDFSGVAASGEEPGLAQQESEEVLLYEGAYTASDFDDVLELALDFTRSTRADFLERGMRLVLTDDGESVEVRAVPLIGSPSRGGSAHSSASRRKKVGG
jgi:transcriptional regulator with XRE-family HTH domain